MWKVGIALALAAVSAVDLAYGMPAGEALGDVPTTEADVSAIAIQSYVVRRGLKSRTEFARATRQRMLDLPPGLEFAAPITGTAVRGRIEIPVIAVTFANTAVDPYPVGDLQTELFDGPWPTGTMTEHYREMSGGRLTVDGEVIGWIRLPQVDSHYSGAFPCQGLCATSNVKEMLQASLFQVDSSIDFSRFDNDGADNIPNSGDDDGFVDFVAFVHPESGGECQGADNDNIWSHRFSIRSWTGTNFQTNDTSALGGNIFIDDYVVMPALACDRETMIQIGVFSHEFGHAFGLPDLYDTSRPARSEGVGNWDLMAAGSWGGDNVSPDRPAHMSAWSKEFLGWVQPQVITGDTLGVTLRPVVTSGDVARIDYADAANPEDNMYLLLEYRTQTGFDDSLLGSGLLVTEINNTRVQSGLVENRVNALQFDMGVNVIEADGRRDLDNATNRGDDGDLYLGSASVSLADITHSEHLSGALCNIVVTGPSVTLDVFVSRSTCPGNLEEAAITPGQAAVTAAPSGTELVVQGTLTNLGTNYFNDRDLVLEGIGGSVSVTAPAPLEASQPIGGPDTSVDLTKLSDVLGKTVFARGTFVTQVGPDGQTSEHFVIRELQIAE